MPPKLGIVAGGGTLPAHLVEICRKQGREVFVLALKDHADAATFPADCDVAWIRMGEAGTGISTLHEKGVKDVVMAGPVRRPTLREMSPDLRTIKFFARIGLKALGDDGLLRALIAELESEGFKVVGTQDILGGVLARFGDWGKVVPNAQNEADIARGLEIARGLGALDIGQAVVAQQGIALGVEAAEGTAELIRRCAALRREGDGPVLVKIAKPGQDTRVDLPTIGPETVRSCAAAGFAGIAVEAGATLVIDREKTIAVADEAGLFLRGVDAGKK